MDIFQQDLQHKIFEYSVRDISVALKEYVENNFGRLRIRGEISQLNIATSGHVYLKIKDLTDGKYLLDAIIWSGVYKKIKLKPEEGMEILILGHLTTYSARSNYQLIIHDLELAGSGAFFKMLEDRKKKLSQAGVFDQDKKLSLPFLPKNIGIITSDKGAALQDILCRLNDRFPTKVIIWPVLVQGEIAAENISLAINSFNEYTDDKKPDILIIARGGGSYEDLMPFNEECVVMAVFNSAIPVISAVGHETDTTLIDYVADIRAPTPTAAAEIAVPIRAELINNINDKFSRISCGIRNVMDYKCDTFALLINQLDYFSIIVKKLEQKIVHLHNFLIMIFNSYCKFRQKNLLTIVAKITTPKQIIIVKKESFDNKIKLFNVLLNIYIENINKSFIDITNRLSSIDVMVDIKNYHVFMKDTAIQMQNYINIYYQQANNTFYELFNRFANNDYKSVLNRGYAILWRQDNKLVTINKVQDIKNDEVFCIELSDGKILVKKMDN